MPPGANVCVAALANQISFAIRVFFRISDMGCELTLGGPLLFSSLTFRFLHCPSTLPYATPSLPLVVAPLNPARKAWESVVSFPNGVWGAAPAEIEFGTF